MDIFTESLEAIKTETPSEDPLIGAVLGQQYKVEKQLGHGGMGTVYQGIQLSVDRTVAIKVITGDTERTPELLARFKREAQAMAQLRHPNSVRLLDFGVTEEKRMFMVMEWLRGRDLELHLADRKPLTVVEALHITRQVAQSLSEAHARGIVHRDLKPGNIFLAELEGGDCFVKVMDFGVAGFQLDSENTAITMQGEVLGTAAYMSPEQAQGQSVDGRADLYSLGVILFEMLAGRTPFVANTAVSLLLLHVTAPPPRVLDMCPKQPGLARVQALLDSLLAKSKGDRLASAAVLIREIDALLTELGGTISSISSKTPSASTLRRKNGWRKMVFPTAVMASGVFLAWQHANEPAVIPRAHQSDMMGTQVGTGQASEKAAEPDWLTRVSGAVRSNSNVTIATVPSGAIVALGGAELGTTPYKLQIKGRTVVEVSLPGHATQSLTVDPGGEPNLIVKLTPLPPYRAAMQKPL